MAVDDTDLTGGPLPSAGETSVRKWLTFASVEGACANVFTVLTSGAFLTGLALMLGADDLALGLLGAIPFLAQVAQLLAAYLVDRTGYRKVICLWFSVAGRQSWWVIPPIILLAGRWGLEALILVVAFSSLSLMIATPAWMAWMADLVPDRIRGRYFGYRSAAVAITTLAATIIGGLVLDWFRADGRAATGFAVIIGAAALFALIAAILLNRIPDRPPRQLKIGFSWSHFLVPLRDRRFRHLLLVFCVWNIAVGIAAVFFGAHMLTNLRMSFTQISLYTCAAAVVAVVLNRPWGMLIDRFGSRPVVVFCGLGIALVPFIWLIPRADSLWILWFEAVYSGALWAGFNLGAFTIPIANSPKEGRTIYLAMFSVITGVGFFAASLIGGILAEHWGSIHWSVGPQTVVNYHILFAISGVLRLAAALLIMSFHEPAAARLPIMVQFMGDAVVRRLSVARHIFPWLRNE